MSHYIPAVFRDTLREGNFRVNVNDLALALEVRFFARFSGIQGLQRGMCGQNMGKWGGHGICQTGRSMTSTPIDVSETINSFPALLTHALLLCLASRRRMGRAKQLRAWPGSPSQDHGTPGQAAADRF
ncbi:hypothetical protein [Roseovarius tolerans]|uniref:hypothetical protein n=1 Tax=Roseovarius tolerans TaxID=74031 RepID=UPI001114391D|nr:hypothetical protein [Roseovarius tolerans]